MQWTVVPWTCCPASTLAGHVPPDALLFAGCQKVSKNQLLRNPCQERRPLAAHGSSGGDENSLRSNSSSPKPPDEPRTTRRSWHGRETELENACGHLPTSVPPPAISHPPCKTEGTGPYPPCGAGGTSRVA